MGRKRFAVLTVVGAFAVGLLAAAAPRPSNADATVFEAHRVHAHFDSVLNELHARDLSTLSNAQRANRASLMATLQGYNARGVFPHNYDFPNQPTPYFVDRQTGTLCAVAYLLASTNRRDIVDRVAQANNNVWVAQLAGDAEFEAWLDAHGLTLAEAARIQVPYVATQTITPAQKARNTAFIVIAPVAVGGAAVTTLWNALGNADGHHRVVNVVGLTSGIVATGLGALLVAKSDMPGAARGVGAFGAALGGMSIGLSARAMHRHGVVAAAQENEREARRRAEPNASISPIVPVGGNSGAGLAVAVRF